MKIVGSIPIYHKVKRECSLRVKQQPSMLQTRVRVSVFLYNYINFYYLFIYRGRRIVGNTVILHITYLGSNPNDSINFGNQIYFN